MAQDPVTATARGALIAAGGRLLLIADHAPFGAANASLSAAFGVHMHTGFTEIPGEVPP